MVWEVVTPSVLPRDPKDDSMQGRETQAEDTEMIDASGEQSYHSPHTEVNFLSSPSAPTSNSYMEYDDLPDLQEVREESNSAPVYQVEVGVSHQERQAHGPDAHWLTQLAHIATGPQSPLLQEAPRSSPSPFCIQSTSRDLHSYARPPPSPPPPPPPPLPPSSRSQSAARGHSGQRRRSRRISECSSAVSTRSSLSDDEDMGWSVSCPPTAWHCFLKGTRVRFDHGPNVKWRDVEDLESADEESDDEDQSRSLKGYGSEGLKLVEHAEIVLSGQTVLQLTFDPGAFGRTPVTARCPLDHPFYIKSKGWSSFHPSLTVVHYGIPCYEMEVGDVCLPPGHRDAKHTEDSPVFDTFRSYAFTPLDSSAVYVLSSMARRRRASQSSGGAVSPDRDTPRDAHSPPSHSHATHPKPAKGPHAGAAHGGPGATAPTKCKRPMNAFMLFAKKFRVEYTQMYPGKDNRMISVLLGERWKKMRSEERRAFTLQAKALADEQKRLNPDCWKRKRTNSGCQGN